MSRILLDDTWYDGLSSNSYWEIEYERLVVDRSQALYPEYIAVPFKTTVYSERGAAQADLALVAPDYQLWWVVEVELAHHSLSNHVLPQVSVLATASYGDEAAGYLAAHSYLELERLKTMMRGSQPRVLVIVNGNTDWRPHLAIWDALLANVEVYRSDKGKHMFRVSGDYPDKPGEVLTYCRPDRLLPRLFIVESPAMLPMEEGNRLALEYDGSMSEWEVVTVRDRCWLSPIRTSPVPEARSFAIERSELGRLTIRTDK